MTGSRVFLIMSCDVMYAVLNYIESMFSLFFVEMALFWHLVWHFFLPLF